ncbi:MAG: CRTAC1 family protein [Armatimonadota bacterium]
MENRVARIGLSIVFVGVLAAPVVWSQMKTTAAVDPSLAIQRYGFRLEEASRKAGLDFTHQAPQLDPRLEKISPLVASYGAAASVVDFDRDGWDDLYVTNSAEGSQNRLYRNQQDGTFKDVAAELGVADVNQPGTGVSMGAVWGDYDNDGFEDLFLYKWGRPELFRNEGGKKLTRVEVQGFPAWANANSAVWLDYDRDGRLDLFLGGYYREDVDLFRLRDTRIMPDSFKYATNGGRKYLLRNSGGGKFEDVTAKVGLNSNRWALAAMAGDFRGTGYPDLVIANDYGYAEYFANDGGKFREIGKAVGIADHPRSGMNVSLGDITNSGRLAAYVSNISERGVMMQLNNLWSPLEGAGGGALSFEERATELGVSEGGWAFGAQFGDLNNDGWLDLFLTNGFISGDRGSSYWHDYSQITGAHGSIISDAVNWPALNNRTLAGYQPKKVWLSQDGKRFVDIAPQVGVSETFDGRAVVMGDFQNRGVLDVAVAHQRGPLLFYRNDAEPKHRWVELELEGTKSNRSAIGAQVKLYWDGKVQLQQVSGGSGFAAQNSRRLHFGLGEAEKIDKVEILWPSGTRQTLEAPEIGKRHHVKESA